MPSSGRPSQVSSSPCCTTIRSLFGIEAERPLLMVGRLVVIVAHQVHRGEDAVHVAVVVVERQRDLQLVGHLLARWRRDPRTSRRPRSGPARRPSRHGRGRSSGSSAMARSSRRCASALSSRGRAVVQHLAGEHALVGRHVVGRLALRAVVRRRLDAAGQRRDDRRGHLVLDGEDVLELAVVALGPDMPVGLRVDQLHGDADAVAGLAHAAFDHVLRRRARARPPAP